MEQYYAVVFSRIYQLFQHKIINDLEKATLKDIIIHSEQICNDLDIAEVDCALFAKLQKLRTVPKRMSLILDKIDEATSANEISNTPDQVQVCEQL